MKPISHKKCVHLASILQTYDSMMKKEEMIERVGHRFSLAGIEKGEGAERAAISSIHSMLQKWLCPSVVCS